MYIQVWEMWLFGVVLHETVSLYRIIAPDSASLGLTLTTTSILEANLESVVEQRTTRELPVSHLMIHRATTTP